MSKCVVFCIVVIIVKLRYVYNGVFQDEALGPDNIGGYRKVEVLAEYLHSLRDQTLALSNTQADHVIRLWSKLSDYDKQPTVPSPRHRTRLTKGSITTHKMRSKQSTVPGVDSVKRYIQVFITFKPQCNTI